MFHEAVYKTQEAKKAFDEDDLLERGRQLIRASISHGVTTMRAHVEVDPVVKFKCLNVGIRLKAEFSDTCDIRLVVFAQDPIFSKPLGHMDQKWTEHMMTLLEEAIDRGDGAVAAIGSAPYVEMGGKSHELANATYILDLAVKHGLDADFHLDFDLSRESRFMNLLDEVRKRPQFHCRDPPALRRNFVSPLRVTLGHCRTLSRIDPIRIGSSISVAAEGLEVYIVGLPNSDMYMKHDREPSVYRESYRTVLNPLNLEAQSSFLRGRISLSVNNVGNLFTPQGDGDPLALLPMCVGVFQNAKENSLASLIRMVTVFAASAAGLRPREHAADLMLQPGEPADLVILDGCTDWRMAALSPPFARVTLKGGRVVGKRKVETWVEGQSG
ncbi:Metallo-dependent hydrolase [Dacryopinax primogenitus]|uniref:Metallo-dependent hydrolase n=1 Tax=Dacryopinax primogenitus (strain DJM 731) TaxID=1858805 RepID=M5G245_DACPD|nr:Metallo-dependent hydrolase [Dacryopinax primogenitus]EJT99956.1 Metallo-dependent hydrolase [Dacryopinax primogenitus]